MAPLYPKVASRCSIRPHIIRNQQSWNETVLLEQFSYQLQCGALVSFRLDQDIENFTFGIDGLPQIDHATVDLDVDLVQMPGLVGPRSALAKIRCDPRPEMIHSAPNGLVRNRDAAFRQQILDVAKAQREPDIEPNCPVNDRRRKPVTGLADFIHQLG